MKINFLKCFLACFFIFNYLHASEEEILDSSNIFQLMLRSANNNIPEEVLKNAKAIAIIPNSLRIGFIVSGGGGSGIMSIRGENGWSYPFFVTLGGGNIGLQAGVEKSNKLIVFMSVESINKVIDTGLKLGADATVAAGPLGISNDRIFNSDIYTYTQGKGAFAGVALGGLMISIDDEKTIVTYGNGMDARSIISGSITPPSSYATKTFFNVINKF